MIDTELGECAVFRPSRSYLVQLGLSGCLGVVLGVGCLVSGYFGAGSALTIGLALVGFAFGALVARTLLLVRHRTLLIGERGFEDRGAPGSHGPVTWAQVEAIEGRGRTLLRVILAQPAKGRGGKAFITSQGLGCSAGDLAYLMQSRLDAWRSSTQ